MYNGNLLIKPIFQPGESPLGFLLRVADKNQVGTLSQLLNHFNTVKNHIPQLPRDQKSYEQLLKKMEITKNLHCKTYGHATQFKNSKLNYNGIPLSSKQLRLINAAICPKCIEEKKFAPNSWDFNLITTCTEHKVHLIQNCKKCDKLLKWNRTHLNRCQCGFDLKQSNYHKASTIHTKRILSLINKKDEARLMAITSITHFLKTLSLHLPKNHSQDELVSISTNAIFNNKQGLDTVTKLIISAVKKTQCHPRILLTNLFTSNNSLVGKFCKKTLKQLTALPTIKESTPSNLISKLYTKKDAAIVLGVTMHILNQLLESKMLSITSNKVTANSLNNLLWSLSNNRTAVPKYYRTIKSTFQNPNINVSTIQILQEIITKKRNFIGMDYNQGILSVQFKYQDTKSSPKNSLSMKELAAKANVHYESIRFLIHNGFIIKSSLSTRVLIQIEPEVADDFCQKYIFAGAFAKLIGCNTTNIAEKLKSLGAQPVSGPDIDGGLTYLFLKKDIKNITRFDIESITSYKTKTGRKPKDKNTIHTVKNGISFKKVANQFNITIQQVTLLVRKGLLLKAKVSKREKYVDKKSFRKFETLFQSSKYIDLKEAANVMQISPRRFRTLWLDSKLFPFKDLGLKVLIEKKVFSQIKDFHRLYITDSEFSELIGSNNKHLRNFTKQGILKPTHKLHSQKKHLYFYLRSDVMKLI